MKYSSYGQVYTDTEELFQLLYKNPDLDISKFQVEDPDQYNHSAKKVFYADFPMLSPLDLVEWESVEAFDTAQQNKWNMPAQYKDMDIAQWLLSQCRTEPELQRVGEELLLYQERNLFDLLCYLKYAVDTFRENKIVWGLGRGSSVASYVLYLIGVHKINSMYYDLDISEFLR